MATAATATRPTAERHPTDDDVVDLEVMHIDYDVQVAWTMSMCGFRPVDPDEPSATDKR